jgi:trehalose 6-phosphate phosphatase
VTATRAPRRNAFPARRPALVDPENLARRLADRPSFLCLDYDGTLVPIAARPHQATFDDSGRRLLSALLRHMPIAIISGRSRHGLRALVGVPRLVYVGNHGLEISGPRIRHRPTVPAGWRRDLERLLGLVEADAPAGALVERKGVTASVHYRLVSPADRRRWLPALRARLRLAAARGRLHVVYGKAVAELRPPVDWDKGAALRWLRARPGMTGRTPVYIGDDATDEDAFQAVRRGGIGVRVGGPRRSNARYRLSGHDQVRRLLVCWLRALGGMPDG